MSINGTSGAEGLGASEERRASGRFDWNGSLSKGPFDFNGKPSSQHQNITQSNEHESHGVLTPSEGAGASVASAAVFAKKRQD